MSENNKTDAALALGPFLQHHPIYSRSRSLLIYVRRGLTFPLLDYLQHQGEEITPCRRKERGRTKGTGTRSVCFRQS